MDKNSAGAWVKKITIVWFVIGLAMFGALMAELISKDLFLNLFAGGFIVWVIVISVLSRAMWDNSSE